MHLNEAQIGRHLPQETQAGASGTGKGQPVRRFLTGLPSPVCPADTPRQIYATPWSACAWHRTAPSQPFRSRLAAEVR